MKFVWIFSWSIFFFLTRATTADFLCDPDNHDDQCVIQKNWTETEVCEYVKCNNDACEGGGYLYWTQYVECAANPTTKWLLIAAGIIYMLILFVMVSSTADDFFSPSISSIVAHLRISESVAGVTFMAFGNGAPDVFGAIASVLSSPTPKADLALGELFGAGLFVTTMVLAVTIFSRPFKAEVFSSIRDILFYIVALAFLATCFVLFDHVEIWMSATFLGIYLLYVCTVIVSQILHHRKKKARKARKQSEIPTSLKSSLSLESHSNDSDKSEESEDLFVSHGHLVFHTNEEAIKSRATTIVLPPATWTISSVSTDLFWHLKPWPDAESWNEMNILSKIVCVINIIPTFFFKLTIPLNEMSWSKPLALIQCFTCPIFLFFCIQVCGVAIFPGSPGLWAYALCLSVIMSMFVFILTKMDEEPQFYKGMTSYAGFLMSISWIYLISSEVVNVVSMLGVVSRISHEILGLTILAWSNSIGDLIADVAVAKQGYPRMAMAAAIGGQLFNLLIGFGLPFSIAKAQGKYISLTINPIYRLLMTFLGMSLIFTLGGMLIARFHLRRIHAICLVAIYISFFIFAGLSFGDVLVWN